MNKENTFKSPNFSSSEITEEQKARISRKFRAAKALLARKRPYDAVLLSDRDNLKNEHKPGIHRLPLREVQPNTPLTVPSIRKPYNTSISTHNHFKVPLCDVNSNTNTPYLNPSKCGRITEMNSIRSCPERMSRRNDLNFVSPQPNRNDCDNVSYGLRTMETPVEGGSLSNSFVTPMRQSEFTNLSDDFALAADLEEVLDESVLKEIDALCEERSAKKKEQDKPRDNISDGSECNGDSAMGMMSVESVNVNDAVKIEGMVECDRLEGSVEGSGNAEKIKSLEGSVEGSGNAEKIKSLEGSVEGSGNAEKIKSFEGSVEGSGNAEKIKSFPQAYSDYLQGLNEQQKEAACSDISIPLMIVAGPGSGKTSTMVGRVLMLLNEGIGPTNILATTFTTAAASEMRDRIGAVAGKEVAKQLTISTFHSFCLQLCRLHADKLGRTSEFLIYGHGQQRRAIIEAVRLFENKKSMEENSDASKLDDYGDMTCAQYFKDKSKKWQKFVTQAKASGKSPAKCREMGDEIGAAILENYDCILRSCNALDYHDLISCSVDLLADFPEVCAETQELWKAMVIDEFQDTSAMQYNFLRILASHNRITIVGDEDQSIFSFNGADVSGFDSFRKDFPNHREVRLTKNYRSTRCIVEAASFLIHHNVNRCQMKQVLTDNCSGSKITVKECHNEDAQCSFVIDKILESTSGGSDAKSSYGNVAILYRRQVSGKVFQTAFRNRKIPFNVHGVAFYRKKIIKVIMAMLRTTLPGCDDGAFRQTFKAVLSCEKEEKKKVVSYIDKISTIRKCSFISAARDIFAAKVSGTFKRSQLSQGKKVLSTLDIISQLVHREQSISAVITSVANMLPQKYLLEQRAVVDVDSGKLLNEDNDLRSVLQYLLDDVSNFLTNCFSQATSEKNNIEEGKGCTYLLKEFIDYISMRESENFRSRRQENKDSVTLTTIHQSKGLEWDTVFIVKANEADIPLLHEYNGSVNGNGTSIEEERRLLYVAMTRARKKLYILYVTVDSNWQLLQPSRFLKEIPDHLREVQTELTGMNMGNKHNGLSSALTEVTDAAAKPEELVNIQTNAPTVQLNGIVSTESIELFEACNRDTFLQKFSVEDRAMISHLFHQWARKKAFGDPKRLLDKIGFVIDERLRIKTQKNKDVLRTLRSCLSCAEAFQYAQNILRWEKLPAEQRAHITREKQEHFQRLRIENAMGSSDATPKQIAYLQSLGCTVVPTSRLHASRLIEQYKTL